MENGFLNNIVSKVKELIINPKNFWLKVKDDDEELGKILINFFIPILVVIALVVFIGEFFKSSHFYMGFGIFKAIREVLLFVLEYFIAVFFTSELLKTFKGEKNADLVRKLVLYSMTPFLLVSIVTGLFPFLYVLDILGVYSFYLFWLGAKELLVVPEEKQNSFILITIIVNFFVFSFLSILLSKLLEAFL